MVLVNELASFSDALAAATLALAPLGCLSGIGVPTLLSGHKPVQIIQDLDELPVRKTLNQGHTAQEAETAPHLRGGLFSYPSLYDILRDAETPYDGFRV